MLTLASIPTFLALLLPGLIVAAVYYRLVMRPGAASAPGRRPSAAPAPPPPPRRAAPVSLRDVLRWLAQTGDEETVFLDRGTGEFVPLADELMAVVESDDDDLESTEDLDGERLDLLRGRLAGGQLVALPTKSETREFLVREKFCDGLAEGEVREQMLKVMRGQTGFRSFTGAVERLGLATQWDRFRDDAFAPIAVAWLEKHGLPYANDLQAASTEPPPLRAAS